MKTGSGDDAFFVIFEDETTGLAPLFPVRELEVQPNPASGQVTVSGVDPGDLLTVRDTRGVTVLEQMLTHDRSEVALHLLPAGIYFFRVVSGRDTRQVSISKVVVK